MALKFYPRAGEMFMCNLSEFKAPEMDKVRPVIVISPRLPYRSEIVTLVPISLTPPRHDLPFCYRLSKNYNPNEPDDLPCWAKCDMLLNLCRDRLTCFKIGRRKYYNPRLTEVDFEGVRRGVLHGLGMGSLISLPAEAI